MSIYGTWFEKRKFGEGDYCLCCSKKKKKKRKKRNEFSSFRLLRTKKVKKTVSRPEHPWFFTLPAPNSAGATLHTHLPSTLCKIHPISGVYPHSTSPYCCLLLIAQLCPCPTLCNPKDCITSGSSVFYYLSEFAQFYVVEPVMLPNHLILCRPLLLLPSVFPSIRVFSDESTLRIRWPKYRSLSFSFLHIRKKATEPSDSIAGLVMPAYDCL